MIIIMTYLLVLYVVFSQDLINICSCSRYPNDSEKLMLASQTGLSKNQVSNCYGIRRLIDLCECDYCF